MTKKKLTHKQFQEKINKIRTEWPDIVTTDMILEMGLAKHGTELCYERKKGYLQYEITYVPFHKCFYKKEDVIDWYGKKNGFPYAHTTNHTNMSTFPCHQTPSKKPNIFKKLIAFIWGSE